MEEMVNNYNYNLTIIIPVYNKEALILQCLESINKTIQNTTDVIIVDDGSTDDSGIIINEWIKDKPKFKYIYKNNGGVSSARNKGLEYAKGKYILFVDADDMVTSEFAELQEKMLLLDTDMIFFDAEYITNNSHEHNYRDDLKAGPISIERAKQLVLDDNLDNNVWSHIYRKDLIEKYHILFKENITIGEDFIFNSNYVSHLSNAVYMKGVYYSYITDHDNSAMHIFKPQFVNDIAEMYESYEELYNSFENARWEFKYVYYQRFIYMCLKNIHGSDINFDTIKFENSKLFKYLFNIKLIRPRTLKIYLYVKLKLYKLF